MNQATLDQKQTLDQRNWRRLLEPYKRSSTRAAVVQLVDTAVPFVLLWYLMAKSVSISYLLTLALAVPTAFLLIRLFILQHDCGHGSLFPSRVANHVVGSILGVVTLFPYGYWRRTHAMHHATSGNLERRELGDIKTYTVREYRAFSPLRRGLYRLYRHPLVLLGFGPFYQFVLKHRFPFDIPWSWKREWASVVGTNVGIAAVLGALVWGFGWSTVVLVHVPIIVIGGAIAVFLFYVQHQFDDTYWEHQEGWDFYSAGVHGSSFLDLPRPLHWLTGNIGYHHIHHLVSRIPNYRLAQCFDEVPGLQRVTRLSLGQGVRCLGLKLWDEETRTLVGFDAVQSEAARPRSRRPGPPAGPRLRKAEVARQRPGSTSNRPGRRALSAWENEGGSVESTGRTGDDANPATLSRSPATDDSAGVPVREAQEPARADRNLCRAAGRTR